MTRALTTGAGWGPGVNEKKVPLPQGGFIYEKTIVTHWFY